MAILDGIAVLDFSQGLVGNLATMLLADNGAQVTRVEPPGGDPWRAEPAWIMWNRGKRSVVLDLSTPLGRERARALARRADVLVENFLPGTAESLGIGYEALAAENPRLVYCSITALGPKGAYRQLKPYDGLVSAKVGDHAIDHADVGAPEIRYRARPLAGWAAANLAVQGIAGALLVREQTGLGQQVATSLYQGLQLYASHALARQQELGLIEPSSTPPRRAGQGRPRLRLHTLVVRCKDGQWLQVTCVAARLFPNWMKTIGLGHIYADERFKGAPYRFPTPADEAELRRLILERMQEKTLAEWLALFRANDVAADPILTTQQAMDDPQMRHNGAVIALDDPAVGPTEQIGPLVVFERTPAAIRGPAPAPGQHSEEALGEAALAAVPEPAVPSSGTADPPPHPFSGMTILDFASWLATPVGTAILADLGARVIKVEPPAGDELRTQMGLGEGRPFQGKESLALDLKAPEGRAAIHRLLPKVDAVVHNLRGEAPRRLGIDYETVRRINPDIVYLYAGSYGSTGPGAGRGMFNQLATALTGAVLWQLGAGNQPPPPDEPMTVDQIAEWSTRLLEANDGGSDHAAGLAVATALALALYEKRRSGKGQYVETRMLTSNAYLCADDFLRYRGKPERVPLDRNQRGTHALNRYYRTAEGWLFVCCPLQAEFEALCRALGRPEWLADRRFADRAARLRHDVPLVAALAEVFKEKTAREWERALLPRGVPVASAAATRVDDFLLLDESVKENGFVVWAERPSQRPMFRPGPAVSFSRTPARADLAPAFGEHTRPILREAGLSAEEIAALIRSGIAVSAETPASGPAGRATA